LSVEYLKRCLIKLHGSQIRIVRYIKGNKERNEKEREINRNEDKRKAAKGNK